MLLVANFRKRLKVKFHKIFLENFEYIYKSIHNQKVDIYSNKQLPNIVYQTWVNNSLPWRMAKSIKIFREINKDFSFILYDHNERDKYMLESWGNRKIYQIYKNSVFQSSKADIWRYCILFEKGGYYFDIKSSCKTPISKLKVSRGATISYEPHNTYIPPSLEIFKNNKNIDLNVILNWAFGFKKKHPLLKIQIENIEKYSEFFKGKIFQNPKAAILAFTGPGMLTKSYRDYLKIHNKKIIANGIDFNGSGIYEIEGSQYRYKQSLNYSKVKNSKILI